MLMKVSDLDGRALNWAVAFCLWGEPTEILRRAFWWDHKDGSLSHYVKSKPSKIQDTSEFNPAGDWAHGGPLIDRYATQLSAPSNFDNEGFIAATYARNKGQGLKSGGTFLVAFCRSLVSAMNRKDEIEIPDELCEVKS